MPRFSCIPRVKINTKTSELFVFNDSGLTPIFVGLDKVEVLVARLRAARRAALEAEVVKRLETKNGVKLNPPTLVSRADSSVYIAEPRRPAKRKRKAGK